MSEEDEFGILRFFVELFKQFCKCFLLTSAVRARSIYIMHTTAHTEAYREISPFPETRQYYYVRPRGMSRCWI